MRTLGKQVTIAPALTFNGPVTVDDIQAAAAAAEGAHTIFLEDHEAVPTTVEEVEELLAVDAETHDTILAAASAATEFAPEEDKVAHILATLDALDADKSAEAVAWKALRTDPDGGLGVAQPVEKIK